MTDDNANWDYKPDGQTKKEPPKLGNRGIRPASKKADGPESISWSASEYVEHQRGTGWYLALIAFTVALSVGIYLLTKDYFAVIIVAVTALVVMVFTLQKPREVTYTLSTEGLSIGDKLYQYNHFKSFAVVREEGSSSVSLIPIKRFLPVISLYYEPTKETEVVQLLGQHLPYEDRKLDSFERISRRLRL